MDLALTATYFPHCGLTFGILFGCPLSIEQDILRRLSFATVEAAHPLLLPGIFAELERNRHVPLVEATIDDLETRIFQLDFHSSDMERVPDSEAKKQNQAKRSAWLDTTYLRNGLVSWSTQLAKLGQHANELKETVFCFTVLAEDPFNGGYIQKGEMPELQHDQQCNSFRVQQEDPEVKKRLRQVGDKIHGRIQAIIDEYDDKIRDCTMRVEGMAMATQWVYYTSPEALK